MTHDQPSASGPQAWVPQDVPAPAAEPAHQPGYQQPGYQQPGYQAEPGYQQPGQMPYAPAYPSRAQYAQPAYYGPPAPQRTPTLAILSLVFAFLAPVVGLVLAIVALVRARTDGNGRGLAIAGLAVSVLAIPVLAAIAIPVYLNQRENAQEAGVREALHQMSASIAAIDCEGFRSTTTASFQQQMGAPTCEDFDVIAQSANSGPVEVGDVPIIDIEVVGDVATVTTVEMVAWVEGESPTQEKFEYVVVLRGGDWLIDSIALAD